ncbi:hypothetical protein KBJ98_02200 [Flavobacterium sp. F-328]|uniref:Uncharacterized protein n=1 Tax=Flavobacterium erciyesense TaxID=2825842 RepID=A0ABS5D0F5_9FLAO|nr:hypothetical protein [Flavobacterium erciyesense]MBQ0907508.1 hypothetical protein [Flavobacterium erciyesense]
MKLVELEKFLEECIKCEVPFPKNTMTFVVDDFHSIVPEEHHNTKNLEFRFKVEQEFRMVHIIPPVI